MINLGGSAMSRGPGGMLARCRGDSCADTCSAPTGVASIGRSPVLVPGYAAGGGADLRERSHEPPSAVCGCRRSGRAGSFRRNGAHRRALRRTTRSCGVFRYAGAASDRRAVNSGRHFGWNDGRVQSCKSPY